MNHQENAVADQELDRLLTEETQLAERLETVRRRLAALREALRSPGERDRGALPLWPSMKAAA